MAKFILKKPNETKVILIQLAKRPFACFFFIQFNLYYVAEFAEEIEWTWLHLGEL